MKTLCLVLAGLVAIALVFGCSGPRVSYEEALAHLDEAQDVLQESRSALSGLEVDFNSEEASATVHEALADAAAHTRDARKLFEEARADVKAADGGDDAQRWDTLLSEFDGMIDAHEELSTAHWNRMQQLVIAGVCEVQVPLTDNDLAGAFFGVGAGQPEMVRMSTDIAQTNYEGLRREAMLADKLEADAHVDRIADYCAAQLTVVALLNRAADALEDGDEARAMKLAKKAEKLSDKNQNMPTPALWQEAYAERFVPLAEHWNKHLAAVETQMAALR